MEINIKKLKDGAIIPTYGSEMAAGFDLYACLEEELTIHPHMTMLVKTGISMEIPGGFVGLIYARSGLASKDDLAPANKVGVIDADYRGEIMVALHNHGLMPKTIKPNERIAQMIISPFLKVKFNEVEELNQTGRGNGGFGSTGA